MKLDNKNITGTVIATIISLIAIVTAFGGFMSNQTKLEVQLASIQKELITINEKLDKRDVELTALKEDVIILKEKIK